MNGRNCLAGGGEMGALMRSIDWSQTAVGPVQKWPQSLRTALSIMLETGFPMYIAWGREFTQFYNDGYRPILGSTKHPAAMGISTRETFAEIWDIIGPMFDGAMHGTPTTFVDFLLQLDRHGFVEECYFKFSYSPIREESGDVGGVLVTVTETTERVLGERRLTTLRELALQTSDAKTVDQACAVAGRALAANPADIPTALIYLAEPDGRYGRLMASAGVERGGATSPERIELGEAATRWPHAMRLPLTQPGVPHPAGILVAATSPRLLLDAKYRGFLELVAGQIATAVANARALEEAEARAQSLAELDRAKTAFFSNVSHELRTPLTLLLGPATDALDDAALPPRDRERWQLVQRNAARLSRLVNSLLDFSRIEAGRVEACYQATDLAQLTTDLAASFRSAMEKAGLELVVDAPPLPAPAYVDRAMWEKIVLNLVSNAFKHTFEGRIVLTLRSDGESIRLEVRDSGIGIAVHELPRLFERFHRVRGARSRSHEGTGIGLALVQELVQLHGGRIDADSVVGAGTRFTVTIPVGATHLAADRVEATRATVSTAIDADAFVNEALSWLPSSAGGTDAGSMAKLAAPQSTPGSTAIAAIPRRQERIVLADDNADMRHYLERLLAPAWTVEAVADGHEALEACRRQPPDLVISDVMMPNLDGFGLLGALRAEPATQALPVILLSARAGEEATSEGLAAGANDYLIKPFSARELLARVRAQLEIGRAHQLIKRNSEIDRQRLHSFLMQVPAAIAVLRGPELVYELANDLHCRIVGRRDLIGRSARHAVPELAAQGLWDLFDDIYRTGEPLAAHEFPAQLDRRGDGRLEPGHLNWFAQPTYAGTGAIEGVMVVAIDVTEQVLARQQIEDARRSEQQLRHSAEQASRAKDQFLAMLGHELRNPLAPILTALQLMRLRGDESLAKERTVIERHVHHVVRLVDDLLDVSRITRGKIDLKKERLELAEIVAKAIEMTSPLMEERRHSLIVEVPRAGLAVDGDQVRLAQVLSNLLNNAAKYTEPHGRILVAARREGGEIALRVRDSGMGIPPEIVPHVFDLFVQQCQAVDRSQGGLGLGLAIVRSLVQLHGGGVEAHSDGRGCGSEFVIRLPVAASSEEQAAAITPSAADPRPRPDGLRVLVVDDNADAADLLADCLRAMGHLPKVAYDGPQALQIARLFAPAVALLDIGLPVMDGYELAQQLRQQLPSVVLVAITGYGQETDRRRTRTAGFAEHLVKPINLDEVGRLLERAGNDDERLPV